MTDKKRETFAIDLTMQDIHLLHHALKCYQDHRVTPETQILANVLDARLTNLRKGAS